MNRRDLITLVGGAAAAWPMMACAQQAMPVIGHMQAGTAEDNRDGVAAFEQGLGQLGYFNGRNVTIEYRWAEGQYDRLPALAAELVSRRVTLIAAGTPVAALAAKRATASIPIVFAIGSDPVKDGLVASLNRPGGNVTGSTFFSNLLTAKRLGQLREFVPDAKVVVVLVNPKNANANFQTNEAQEAARSLGLQVLLLTAATAKEIDKAFEDLGQQRADGLLVLSDSFLNSHAAQILNWRYAVSFLHALRIANRPWRVGSWVTERAALMPIGRPAATRAVFSRVKAPLICRFSSPPSLNSS